ncbi:DNA-binding CsgD family transcriptional regulator [Streptosporangium becharense]|uniref:DNA-binding CsgD family transcriptional regulator n=1 Tax=Streptosporangium becharense TaxID=1816182 RepID=A0A7W9IMT9_9ACTN|nr:LuxR C-terminal-related transcriptional regulator [Streptosporangium becharense]MBB2914326.1 DNA-binding CsgD family transcriptional regulator [Streptosporangium becharense]MBB5823642.1 DNA-binding CsgD family transcriptional regulator [Streptosporangium becharense]
MLASLGLDATAEAVYRAMLTRPRDGVTALAAHLALTEEEVRRSLDTLSELTLVRPSYEYERQLRAVSPDIGMEILMARQQAELAAQQQRLEASRVAAAQMIAEFADLTSPVRHPEVERLIGLDAIRDRIASLARALDTEILTFAPGGAHRAETIEASKPQDEALLTRGVRMRAVYLNSIRNSSTTLAYVAWLAELGGEVRTAPELPTRMIIFDGRTALIPVDSNDSAASAVLLTGQGTLAALCALFETVWAKAQPLSEPVMHDASGLSAQEAAVIHLLAQGFTDEAIAKRLGVSPRTARRLASELMDRLGARSRFEFGMRAVQQGWLPKQQ